MSDSSPNGIVSHYRECLGHASYFCTEDDHVIAIIGQLGFLQHDGTLYVRVLAPSKHFRQKAA